MTIIRDHEYGAAEQPFARCDDRWDELRCDLAIGHQSTHQALSDGTLHSWKDHIPTMFGMRLPPPPKRCDDGAPRRPTKPARTPVAA